MDTPLRPSPASRGPRTIGSGPAAGGSFAFSWADVRRVDFSSDVPTTMFGLQLRAAGYMTLRPDQFRADTVTVDKIEAVDGDRLWLDENDRLMDGYFMVFADAVQRAVGQAFDWLVDHSAAAVPNAMLNRLDDLALERIGYLDDWERRAGGRSLQISERRYRPDFPGDTWRQIEAIDEMPLRHQALLSSLPLYTVHDGNRPFIQTVQWGRTPVGRLGRACVLRYASARELLERIGQADAQITRCRLMNGKIYRVMPEGGFQILDLDFEHPANTMSDESMEPAT